MSFQQVLHIQNHIHSLLHKNLFIYFLYDVPRTTNTFSCKQTKSNETKRNEMRSICRNGLMKMKKRRRRWRKNESEWMQIERVYEDICVVSNDVRTFNFFHLQYSNGRKGEIWKTWLLISSFTLKSIKKKKKYSNMWSTQKCLCINNNYE